MTVTSAVPTRMVAVAVETAARQASVPGVLAQVLPDHKTAEIRRLQAQY